MREAIVLAYTKENMLQKDIATRFRVTPILVSRLICEARVQPVKQQELLAKELSSHQVKKAIKQSVEALLRTSVPIKASREIVQKVYKETGLEVKPA